MRVDAAQAALERGLAVQRFGVGDANGGRGVLHSGVAGLGSGREFQGGRSHRVRVTRPVQGLALRARRWRFRIRSREFCRVAGSEPLRPPGVGGGFRRGDFDRRSIGCRQTLPLQIVGRRVRRRRAWEVVLQGGRRGLVRSMRQACCIRRVRVCYRTLCPAGAEATRWLQRRPATPGQRPRMRREPRSAAGLPCRDCRSCRRCD